MLVLWVCISIGVQRGMTVRTFVGIWLLVSPVMISIYFAMPRSATGRHFCRRQLRSAVFPVVGDSRKPGKGVK